MTAYGRPPTSMTAVASDSSIGTLASPKRLIPARSPSALANAEPEHERDVLDGVVLVDLRGRRGAATAGRTARGGRATTAGGRRSRRRSGPGACPVPSSARLSVTSVSRVCRATLTDARRGPDVERSERRGHAAFSAPLGLDLARRPRAGGRSRPGCGRVNAQARVRADGPPERARHEAAPQQALGDRSARAGRPEVDEDEVRDARARAASRAPHLARERGRVRPRRARCSPRGRRGRGAPRSPRSTEIVADRARRPVRLDPLDHRAQRRARTRRAGRPARRPCSRCGPTTSPG